MEDQNSSSSNDVHIHSLAKRITFLREQKEMSQEQLAASCGLPLQTIKRLEEGLINPTVGFLVKIAEGLGVTLKELFNE